MTYRASPDGVAVLDPEAGESASPTVKPGMWRGEQEYISRAAERGSARDLDAVVEGLGLTRARRDLERAFPRSAVAPIPARRRRGLPIPDQIRTPLSARQRNARSRAKRSAQDRLTRSGHREMSRLVSDSDRWTSTGRALTDVAGDAQHLDDAVRARVQRVDRAIRTAEQHNDREHIVYVAVQVPHHPGSSAPASVVPGSLREGAVIEFDRFTMTTHTVHQLESTMDEGDVVLEIATSRGMYLGRSDKVDDTAHLLPRGLRFEVVSAGEGRFRRPDGTVGRRTVVQLVDVTTAVGE